MKKYFLLQSKPLATLVFLLYTLFCTSQTSQTTNTAGNYTITVPAGVSSFTIDAYGGGGGGGSSANTATNGGSGGGGGAYAKGTHTVTAGSTYYFTVGTGGTGGPANNSSTAPTAGTSSWFNATGTNTAPTTNVIGTLGYFGGAGVNNSTATPINRGVNTSCFGNVTTASGISGSPGTNSGGGNGGTSASPSPGSGGAGSTSTNGANGTNPGGGGGGGDDDANDKGGDGGTGRIAITWTCPTYALTSAATATGPFCGASTSVVTLRSTSLTSGTYTVTYNLTGASVSSGNTATMTFTSGGPGTGTFTTPSLNIGNTTITITNLSSGSGCLTTISSNNTASVTVNPILPASVSITASATTICFGTNVTFTAVPTNGGTIPAYQWKLNGINVGTNSTTYTNSTLVDTDVVTCVLTSNATPCLTGSPATSNTVTMTVNPILPASVSISASATTICAGTNVTFTAVPTNGGASPSYQWKLNGTNVGTNSTTYTNNALANGDLVTCVLTSNATPCLTGSPATSNTVTMTVNPNLPASVSISASTTTICAGTNVTFTAVPTNGGAFPSYQWKLNGTNVGTNSTTYTNSSLTNGNTVTCVLTSNATPCLTGSPATSNTVTMTVSSPMIVDAGLNILTCSTTGLINITSGSGAVNHTSIVWTTTGFGALNNTNSLINCTYTPTVAENNAGSTISLTLTALNAGCSNVISTKTLSISKAMSVAAGTVINTCSTSGAVNITADSNATNQTGVTWTSSGTGTFANATSLTSCTYDPSVADTNAGSITLTLTASNTGCADVFSTKTLNISKAMTANAGTALTTCSTSGAVNIIAGSSATNQTGVTWTSSGTGIFVNSNSLTTCTYAPSATDIATGNVTLTLTASNAGCSNVTSTKTLTIIAPTTAVAGTAINTCSTSGAINITAGSSATNQTSVTWTSSGTGTFTNANSLTTCTYSPSAADIAAGNVTLTLTATNAGCFTTSTKTLTIYSVPTSVAGFAINTCSTSGAVNITAGSSATNQTNITWTSSGTGAFVNANSLTTCTYNPSAVDINAGNVILTLTASNPSCSNVTSTKTLTISYPMTAVAGTAVTTCATSGAVNITAGSSATNQIKVTWTSNGTGTFANENSLTTCTYTPSAADILAVNITLTLTALNAGCANVTATKTLTISKTMTAVAGTVINTCSTSGAVNITAGSSATNQTGITWTSSGTGTFTNATSLTTCTYDPSAADIAAGNVTLTLTASNVACPNVLSTKTLTISKPMTSVAGSVINTCSTFGAVNITAGSSATNQTGVTWTSSGTGTFASPNSLTTCTYTPSPADITAVNVTLTLTATNAGCTNVTSTKSLIISKPMTAVAGTAINTCSTSGAVNITTGSSATNQISVTWSSSGTGIFANTNSLTTCTYDPSAADITAGIVTLTLTTSNAGCSNVTATKTLTISKPMIAVAGTDITTCSIVGAVNITAGASATNQTNQTWSSSGTGTFANVNSLTTCTYTPSAADITAGSVTLTLTTTNAACGNDTATKTLIIYTSPTVTGTTFATRTGVGTVILGASASVGTLYWYSSLTGGTLLGFGSSFLTPSISTTTTYYVEAVNGGICTSTPRVAVTATVLYSEIDIKGNGVAIVDGDTTPSTTDWTDFVSTNLTRTFTISNSGAGVLAIDSIIISGTNASEFSVTTNPNDNIASGSNTTFTVTFSPTAPGTRTATITIANNDITENPYNFNIQGTGVAQEINIQGNAISIVDGDITPSTTDWTDFDSVTANRTYTIQNTGNIPLTIGDITFTGTNPADFAVTTAPSATVAAYSSTTFVVTFTPNAIGDRMATISITNNDSTENPYDIGLHGYGIIPEIDIQGNAISIVDGDTSPVTTDWTDFSTTTVTRTYTIKNDGNTLLTIGAISFSGSNPTDFSVTTAPSATVGALSSTSFVVTFNPGATGTRSATISIVNNDTTGGENPYTFKLQGTGVAQEIDIQGNATSIPDGDTSPLTSDWTDYSTVALTRKFTIFNSGNIPLTIGAITFSGSNPTDFSVTTAPSATLVAFGSTTFEVKFNTPATSGTRSATISIINNDSTENPYNFKIQGTSGIPEINITSQYDVTIADNDTTPSSTDQTDLGEVSIEGGSLTVNFIIQNTGTSALSIGAASFSGTNASDFTMITAPSSVIAAGGISRFQIKFANTIKGTRTATFSIVNNDGNENPYNFNLTGFGVQTYFDADGDGVTDNKDIDDDNDGINDVKEQTDGLAYPLTSLVKHDFLNETFGTGTTKGEININTPGASCTYCYEDGYGTTCEVPAMVKTLEDGEYCVTYKITGALASDPENIHGDLAWYDGLDHTPGDTNGRMAVFNASFPVGTFYETRIDGIIPNAPINYSFWALNIMRQNNFVNSILPNITVEFVDLNYNLITSYNTGFIGRCTTASSSDNTCATAYWLQYSTTANLGDLTSCIIRFKNNSTGGGGNDLALDDINISQNYIDNDGDGIANIFDLDDENDGIPDVEEAGFKGYSNGLSNMDLGSSNWVDANHNGLNDAIDALISGGTYSITDTDGDGIPNYLDLDSDNDSIYDVDEAGISNGDGDINGDGKGDLLDADGDGILDLYDNNNSVFGTSVRAFAQDIDADGIPDYLELDSNNDGIKDIKNGLYSSLDANNDGKVDGSSDSDKDGLLDTFDTSDQVIGSPRDLNRKLQLEFDGRNDYGQGTGLLSGLDGATLMAWVDLNSAFSTDGVIIGQTNFNIKITTGKRLEAVVNGTTYTFITPLNTSQWTHVGAVYGGGFLKLYINGVMVKSNNISGNLNPDISKLTIGKDPTSNTNYFKGKIDELRVFNTALTDVQFQRMVYQEIQNTSSQVRGAIIPVDIGSLTYSKVARYYRMDAYNDDVIDDLTTLSLDNDAGMKIYNNKNIYSQQAPVPFVTERTGNFATALNSTTNDIRGEDATDFDYSIIRVKHNITETSNSTDLGMIVDSGINIVMNNNNKLQNDWYLKLDGKIDLVGRSQLIQTSQSVLDATSSGSIERDQQGQSNQYNYNYWCSPTSPANTVANNRDYTIDDVLRDGTVPESLVKINWVSSVNGAPTSPISISNSWLYKFDNYSNAYANWVKITPTTPLRVGQGFTMKGSGTSIGSQNLTFVGKPNNGTITTNSVGSDQLLLTGNPYPSSLNANQFISDNSSTIDGTLYFWEQYTSNNTHVLKEYQGGYASRNLTGGLAATSSNVDFISKLGTPSKGIPNQYIPVGQGFFVNGKIGGGSTVTFNNGQRGFQKEDASGVSNVVYKTSSSTKKTSSIDLSNNANDPIETEEFMKIRLGFNSNNMYHRQVLLGFMNEKASSGMDYGYDGLNFDDFPNDMYFLNGENPLVIQGEGYFDSNASYPIGVKTNVEGKVSFMIDDLENFDTDQSVYIYDKVLDTYHDIRNEKFEIKMPIGVNDTRFSLRFTDKTLKVNTNTINDIQIKHIQNGNMLVINNNLLDLTVEKVTLFNILGQSVSTWKVENQEQQNIQIPIKNISAGVYIAKIKTSNGNMSKKIIIN